MLEKVKKAAARLVGMLAPPFESRFSRSRVVFQPLGEALENRDVPSVVTVENIADASEAGTTGLFRFTRHGDLTDVLIVNYTLDGTATSGDDHTGASNGTIIFDAESATADLIVEALDDGAAEAAETVIATVIDGADYTSDGSPATLTIADNEAPVVTIESLPQETEEDGPVERLRITRVGDLSQPTSVAFTIDPDGSPALAWEDYYLQGDGVTLAEDGLGGTVVFEAGSATADIYVVPAAAAMPPVLLTLQAGVGYVVGAGATVPVQVNQAQPSSAVDLRDIRTDVTYKVDVTVITTQPGGRVQVTTTVATLRVTIGSTPQDLRDDIDRVLDNAGYKTKPLGDNRLRVYSTANKAMFNFGLRFYDARDANGQAVPVANLRAPILRESSGIPVEYNGTKLKLPE